MSRLDDYDVLEPLGRGAMGTVVRAHDRSLGRDVAIKQLVSANPRTLARFATEAAAIGRLQHPAIVKLHAAELEGPKPHLVMTYVEGESLDRRLERGPLPPERVRRLGVTLADALAHAHAHGILHRDLKPANVLLGADGRDFLTDFGLAKDLSEAEPLTRTGQVVGTPSYMSPEQANGARDAIGPATDVYGLGATLYAALAGVPPFDQPTFPALMVAIDQEPPKPLRVPDLDPGLAAVVMRCLAKRPADRFADAAALIEALSDPTPHTPPRSWGRPALVGAAALACLAAGLALTRPPDRAEPTASPTATPAPTASVAAVASDPPARADPGAWRDALERARKRLRRGSPEQALEALEDLDGTAPDLPERRRLQTAVAEAARRLLPREGTPLDRSQGPTLVVLLKLGERLTTDRPIWESALWDPTWRSWTTLPLTRFGPSAPEVQGTLADLDPTNLPLQEAVLRNSEILGNRPAFLPTARRLAAHPYDKARRLNVRLRLGAILYRTLQRPFLLESQRVATEALAMIERARAEGWDPPAGFAVTTTTKSSWLTTCSAEAHRTRAMTRLELRRYPGALADLKAAQRYSSDPVLRSLEVVALQRLGRNDAALALASEYLGARTDRAVRVTVVGALYRIFLAQGTGEERMRKLLQELTGSRTSPSHLLFLCLAHLDQRAGAAEARDRNLGRAVRGAGHLESLIRGVRRRLRNGHPEGAAALERLARDAAENWR